MILAGNKDIHKSYDELKLQPDSIMDSGVNST